jgi:hypothetical protein
MVRVPPGASTGTLRGSIANVQTALWVTVNTCALIASVPVRAGPGLASTSKPTDPLPVPEAPDVIRTQEALVLRAVQLHPLPAVTVTVPDHAPGPPD